MIEYSMPAPNLDQLLSAIDQTVVSYKTGFDVNQSQDLTTLSRLTKMQKDLEKIRGSYIPKETKKKEKVVF